MATRGRRMVEMALEKNKSVQVSKESKISENVSLDKNAVSSSVLDELNAPHNVSDLLLDISGISELDLSVSNFPDCLDSSLSIVPVEPKNVAKTSHENIPEDNVENDTPCISASVPSENNAAIPMDEVPENFVVDGTPRMEDQGDIQRGRKRKREERKTNRNLGLAYVSATSMVVPDRRVLQQRCPGNECEKRHLSCNKLSDTQRTTILHAYWDMGELREQRHWIARHVQAKVIGSSSRRQKTNSYHLPGEDGDLPVCRRMFLNTLNISEKVVRNVLSGIDENGILRDEGRGGDRNAAENNTKRQYIQDHIQRFPKMESHYCRTSSTSQYLSSDLTVAKMYALYKESPEGREVPVSCELYRDVFKEQNLKFHHPKKDTCGLCETMRSTPNPSAELEESFNVHTREKEAAREILAKWRSEAKINKDVHVAIFDLEKVLYVPKSNRGEIFYKRRLACLNFTVFDVGSSQGHCYFWNESLAGRGANEIASCLHQYAQLVDNTTSATSLVLFSDGCAGQNKNSILPTMFRHFLLTSKTLQSVRLHYFETNHGQSEGDCIHSVIERAVNKIENIAVPSELVGIIKAAAKTKPYVVNEITTEDVFDYKTAATASGILRVRSSDNGNPVSWPAFMQMEVSKDKPGKISFKTSHVQAAFEEITLPARRSGEAPVRCIETAPKLSAGKYKDLADLCSGPKPVISNPDQRKFYLSLPHS